MEFSRYAVAAGLGLLTLGCPSTPPLCADTCPLAHDGECDDGRPGAVSGYCDPGTDCSDCGSVDAGGGADGGGPVDGGPVEPTSCAWDPPPDVAGTMTALAGGDMLVMPRDGNWVRIPCAGGPPIPVEAADAFGSLHPMRQQADGRVFLGSGVGPGGPQQHSGTFLAPNLTTQVFPIGGTWHRVPDDAGGVFLMENDDECAWIAAYSESGAPQGRTECLNGHMLLTTLERGFVLYDAGEIDRVQCRASVDAAPVILPDLSSLGSPLHALASYPAVVPAARDGVFFWVFFQSPPRIGEAHRGSIVALTCEGDQPFRIPFGTVSVGAGALNRIRDVISQWTTDGGILVRTEADGASLRLGSSTGAAVVGVFDGATGEERWTRALESSNAWEAAAGPFGTVWVSRVGSGVSILRSDGSLLAGNLEE